MARPHLVLLAAVIISWPALARPAFAPVVAKRPLLSCPTPTLAQCTNLACNDDDVGAAGGGSRLELALEAGREVFLVVDFFEPTPDPVEVVMRRRAP
jgi:hypothetical protein